MRNISIIATLSLSILAGVAQTSQPETFHLFFIGHDIGRETDTVTNNAGKSQLRSAFHFLDRSTAVDLDATLDSDKDGAALHLVVKGRNYRLFNSDSDITLSDGRVHIREFTKESDLVIGNKPFFPVDNYAPIGVQEALIEFWLSHGRPAEILSAPAGPIHIKSRGGTSGGTSDVPERLSIEGVAWGTETAWIANARLIALTTWAGALPFEAVREGHQTKINEYIQQAAADRVADLRALTSQ